MSDFSSNSYFRVLVAAASVATAAAFQSRPSSSRAATSLNVAVDPTVVTKKEYQDICGAEFDNESLQERLKATNFLYPKHVEVIEDIAPIAGAMVDDIVSSNWCLGVHFCALLIGSKDPVSHNVLLVSFL